MKPSAQLPGCSDSNDDRLAVSICEAGRLLSIGRSLVYVLIKRGILKTVKINRRNLVLMSSITELVSSGA